jgi:hypothetical protein
MREIDAVAGNPQGHSNLPIEAHNIGLDTTHDDISVSVKLLMTILKKRTASRADYDWAFAHAFAHDRNIRPSHRNGHDQFHLLSYPLDTPNGISFATLMAMPRLWTTFTTSSEGL